MSVSKGAVLDAAKKLKAAWTKVRREWDDERARAFEAEYLEPIASKLRGATDAMDALAAASARAERECSP